MTANSNFRIAELDPSQIKTNLKEFLRSQDEFTDFDFEGSGMNIILDLLSFNTHYLAFYINMMAAESFFDSAQLRETIVSHAKHVGYIPNSMKGARTFANIKVTPSSSEDTSASELTLPRWTKFISQALDGRNYLFINPTSNTVVKVDGSFNFSNVQLKQGTMITRTFLVNSDNEKREYFIPSANVDIDEVYVSVQASTTNTDIEVYNIFDDLTELKANTPVFFLEENNMANNFYKVYFGDDYLGKRPSDGNVITITYLDTAGPFANGANSFLVVDSINGYDDNVIVTSSSPAYGGSNRETIEQIRHRAPKYYTSQNRAVTSNDYEIILIKEYPNIQSVSVWGGEEEDPPVYGKVFIALKPKNNYYITNLEKENIIDTIISTKSVMTVIPEIVDPNYTWLLFAIKIYYDHIKTNIDESAMKTLARNSIINYINDNLQKFDSKFRISKFENNIESAHNAFQGVTCDVTMQKRVEPVYGASKTYEIDFDYALKKDTFSTFPAIKVYDSKRTIRDCYIEEVPYSYTGIDTINVLASGTGYEDAIVTITGDGVGATASAIIKNKKIDSIVIGERGTNYTKAEVTITSNTGYGATAQVNLQYNTGNLRLYYFKSNGEKVFINSNIGTIDYFNGSVIIENLNIQSIASNDIYNEDVWTINIQPKESDINTIKRNILDVDINDNRSIQITMVSE